MLLFANASGTGRVEVLISEKERLRFHNCVIQHLTTEHTRDSIGKLAEKTVHAVIKDYLSPDKGHQEVRLGRYVADIFDGRRVTEIQTAHFGLLRPKLSAFLRDYPVTVVLPLPHKKWIVWIDPETGERIKKNLSPVTGNVYDAFHEFYAIKQLMLEDLKKKQAFHFSCNRPSALDDDLSPFLSLRVLLIDMEEYRLLDGWSADKKRGSHRYDRNPVGLCDAITLACLDDYKSLIPADTEEPFTVKGLAKQLHVRKARMSACVNVLSAMGAIKRVENIGHAYAYIRG